MTLKLNGLEVDCIIGDLPEERVSAQTLRIDAEMDVAERAGETDELADTVDYAALADALRGALVSAKCRLVERAAKIALDVCMSDPRMTRAKVSVTKSNPVPGLASATAVAST